MHEVRKTDFELDTSAASASPKGLIATLRQQGILRLNKPFSRSKIKDQVKDLVFYFKKHGKGDEAESRVRQNFFVCVARERNFGLTAQAVSP